MTCREATSDQYNGTGTATIEEAQDDHNQHTEDTDAHPPMTCHTGYTTNPPHTTAHWVTILRTTLDHIHVHLTDHQNIIHTKKNHTA